MKRSYLRGVAAVLALCAVLVPAQLFAKEASEARERRAAPPPKVDEDKKTIAWEKDAAVAATRAKKEDKRILALFFLAGEG